MEGLQGTAAQQQQQLYGAVDACGRQLATIDVRGEEARLLSYLPIERVPEGIEFSADGGRLFVGATLANHIVAYDVEGMRLVRRPEVLVTGYGPSALAISSK